MNAAVEVRRLSVQDYHRMAEAGIFDPGERVELLAGQVVQMAAKGVAHEAAITRTEKALRHQLGDRGLLRLQSPVQLDDYSEPEPDISVVFPDPADYETHHPQPPEIFWSIEVADSRFRYDCEGKAPAYAKSGIAEYWVLDVNQRQLHVYRSPTAEGYQSKLVLAAGDQVAPVAFPDCPIRGCSIASLQAGLTPLQQSELGGFGLGSFGLGMGDRHFFQRCGDVPETLFVRE